MKIYTKTGDKGTTTLYSGKKVSKYHAAIEAVGTIDECSSFLGLALSQLSLEQPLDKVRDQLIFIQNALFDLGAHVATPLNQATDDKIEKTRFNDGATKSLEKWIDKMEKKLTPLKTFILPGGDPAGATIHVARSVCRRAERLLVPLLEAKEIYPEAFIYINRLSDYLFVCARYVNCITYSTEVTWTPHL
ncbi:cob(I)yrinic acid a,c-diamide adenosyltransferase [Chlamydiales bacterium]|nr:cob(I)yrinic acid a,c-diamide adenosyltransferase [Chlamydiales bacterium]